MVRCYYTDFSFSVYIFLTGVHPNCIRSRNLSKGDWASETAKIAEEIEINLTHHEIQNYKRSQFKELVKQKTKLAAFKYLCDKQQAGKRVNT